MPYSGRIKGDISRIDDQRASLTGEIASTKKRLTQLRAALEHVHRKQNHFEDEQANRRAALRNLQWSGLQNRSAQRYAEMMGNMILGGAYTNVNDTFNECIRLIKNQIEEAELQIPDLERIIGNLDTERAAYQQDLNHALACEQEDKQRENLRMEARRRGEW